MPCFGMGSDLLQLGQKRISQDVDLPSIIGDEPKQVRCPECDWEITRDFTWCPQCGQRVKPFQCAYCNGWVPVGLEVCPRCGAPEK